MSVDGFFVFFFFFFSFLFFSPFFFFFFILISSIICTPISFLNFFSRSSDSRNGMTCRTSLLGVDGVCGFLTVAPGCHGCRRDTKSGVGRDGLSQTVPDDLTAFLKWLRTKDGTGGEWIQK